MKIAVDAGHGYNSNGKRTPDEKIREWEFNSSVATKLCNMLNESGIETYRSDDISGEKNIDLNLRVKNINKQNCNLVVSIHANAGGGTGIETYVYRKTLKSYRFAQIVQKKMIEKTRMKDRGIKEGNFAIIRDTKMSAILVECGFMDYEDDAKKLMSDEYRNICAQSIKEGIIEYATEINLINKNPYPGVLSKKGSSGEIVKKIQLALIKKEYSCGKYGADGIFGKDTLAAVQNFQRANNLVVDGIIGPKTWIKLF